MADIILRNLDEVLKQGLREPAARHGRSMTAELREIVREALVKGEQDPNAEFRRLAALSRQQTAGRTHTPAEVLVRESRAEDAK